MHQTCKVAVVTILLAFGALLAACAGPAGRSVAQAAASSQPTAARQSTAIQPTAANPPVMPQGSRKLSSEPHTNQDGAVTIEVTPTGIKGDQLQFAVTLTTHSVDLSYDFQAVASLKDDHGQQYPALGWEGGTGGHHLQGTLSFTSSALKPGTRWLELDLKDIGQVPSRSFRWDVQG